MTQPRAVMPSLREAATQALEVMEAADVDPHSSDAVYKAITALRAALVEGGGNLPPPLQEPKDFDHAIGADRFKVVRGAFWWHVLIGDSPTEHGKFRSRASAEKMAADLLREFRNGAFVQHEAALAEPVEPDPWGAGYEAGYEAGVARRPAQPVQDHFPDATKMVQDADLWSAGYAAGYAAGMEECPAEPVQEPVAWSFELAMTRGEHGYADWSGRRVTQFKPNVPEGSIRNLTPLYTAPPQRKPLTKEEIDSIWDSEKAFADIYAIARAIERAHGIGDNQ